MIGVPSWKKKLLARLGYVVYPVGTQPANGRQIDAIAHFFDAYRRINGIPGCIVECGVGHGRSLLYLSRFAQQDHRVVWGFDSFEGFPEPSVFDSSSRNPKKGEWSGTSEHDIRQVLKAGGITGHVNLIKGFFPDSFSAYDRAPIALLHVDVDLYQSYKDCLNFFYPFVAKGGIVLFDEYQSSKWPGATKAIDDFFRDKGAIQLDSFGKAFFVKT